MHIMWILCSGSRQLNIQVDDLQDKAVIALLREHLASMAAESPEDSCHALDLDGLRAPDVTCWSAWEGAELAGFGAIKRLTPEHGEIKSMKTAPGHLRKGVASKLLSHIIQEAERHGISRLSLETGSTEYFAPARKLYEKYGFMYCEPFGDYTHDPHSVFMTLRLASPPV